ncbi:MAG: hypothetical protein A2505_10610 [Deltaproteobacteria bacterium RIFOXYD12_FULL_55_16]|nr:MAG: hypothetical protein A2505_10610 [Deltaproteobacteria bacterium RIFOXYD12_FULL_55_16]
MILMVVRFFLMAWTDAGHRRCLTAPPWPAYHKISALGNYSAEIEKRALFLFGETMAVSAEVRESMR